jgi:recombination protein RecR
VKYTKALADLIEEFRKFPAIGPKSAQRMAFTLLKKSPEQVEKFIKVVRDAKTQIKYCCQCFNLTANEICEICEDSRRDRKQICVVETVKDLIALERTHEYKGLYHVLGGVISPLDGISADDLNINALVARIKLELGSIVVNESFSFSYADDAIEIILAIGLSTEGEATMLYIKRLIDLALRELSIPKEQIKITRLAHGLPVGADLDYADELTLAKALDARVLC